MFGIKKHLQTSGGKLEKVWGWLDMNWGSLLVGKMDFWRDEKFENFPFLKNFQIFMNFEWSCKLASMCFKMACKHWYVACLVSKSISKHLGEAEKSLGVIGHGDLPVRKIDFWRNKLHFHNEWYLPVSEGSMNIFVYSMSKVKKEVIVISSGEEDAECESDPKTN